MERDATLAELELGFLEASARWPAIQVALSDRAFNRASVRNGAVCIDLRALNTVDLEREPERAVVRVDGGAQPGELDAATQEHGLAVPAGQISHKYEFDGRARLSLSRPVKS